MSTHHCFEDAIRPAECHDVIAEREAALAEQRRLIELVRTEEREREHRDFRDNPPRYGGPASDHWNYRRVQAVRLALGWSREEFAAAIGTDPGVVRNWEAGVHRPRVYVLKKRLAELEAMARGEEVAA